MGFLKKLAPFTPIGMAVNLMTDKKKKEEKPKPSLTTGDFNSGESSGSSLINRKSLY